MKMVRDTRNPIIKWSIAAADDHSGPVFCLGSFMVYLSFTYLSDYARALTYFFACIGELNHNTVQVRRATEYLFIGLLLSLIA